MFVFCWFGFLSRWLCNGLTDYLSSMWPCLHSMWAVTDERKNPEATQVAGDRRQMYVWIKVMFWVFTVWFLGTIGIILGLLSWVSKNQTIIIIIINRTASHLNLRNAHGKKKLVHQQLFEWLGRQDNRQHSHPSPCSFSRMRFTGIRVKQQCTFVTQYKCLVRKHGKAGHCMAVSSLCVCQHWPLNVAGDRNSEE